MMDKIFKKSAMICKNTVKYNKLKNEFFISLESKKKIHQNIEIIFF